MFIYYIMKFTYTFRLSSSSNYINLYKNLSGVTSVKINSFRYTTQSAGTLYALITVSDFNNKIVLDGNKIVQYTKNIPFSDLNQTIINYENVNDFPDVQKEDIAKIALSSFNLDILFGQSSGDLIFSPDVSPSNPIIIEIEFEGSNILS